jgi:hypothetical protein
MRTGDETRSMWGAALTLLASLGALPGTAAQAPPPVLNAADCAAARICALHAPEDLVAAPDGTTVIASRLAGGGLDVLDVRTRRVSSIDLTALPRSPDPVYPCTAFPAEDFVSHGLSLRPDASGAQRLYVVRHGAREAIEVFRFGASGRLDSLSWIGCVPIPKGFSANAVVARRDGGFYVSSMTDPGEEPGAVKRDRLYAAMPSGAVLKWTPGEGFRPLDLGGLSGPNGLELSADERQLYVAGWGGRTILAFDLKSPTAPPRRLAVDFMPDNLRWGRDGALLAAGVDSTPRATLECVKTAGPTTRCIRRWRVVGIDPHRLQPRWEVRGADPSRFGDVSVALEVGRSLWLGSFGGTEVAIARQPR